MCRPGSTDNRSFSIPKVGLSVISSHRLTANRLRSDDLHFPTLTVNQTMKFALRNKVPRERPESHEKKHLFVQDMRDHILNSLGIGHTRKTLVGNEFIRGVSGGERKRMSLAEVMASQVRSRRYSQRLSYLLITFHRALCNSGINQLGVSTQRRPWSL